VRPTSATPAAAAFWAMPRRWRPISSRRARDHGISTSGWSAESLARHTQAVLQGGFVLAKAGNDPDLARESLDHLDRYIRHLFHVAEERSA
jgi:uncharacterized heparinase superfamily protein